MARRVYVGVTSRFGNPEWIGENTRHYIDTLGRYGAEAIVLSPDTEAMLPDGTAFVPAGAGRLADGILDRLNGLVLAGGGDVDPSYFGAELNGANPEAIDRKRDELELALCRGALERDLPVFGICRGRQVLNVAAGGGMVQDFGGHRSSKENPVYHNVNIVPNSKLRTIVGTDCIPVNTYHHQGLDLKTLSPRLQATGTAAPDGWLIEAIESAAHGWVIGVQWHPERLFELDHSHGRLWDSFVAACGEHRVTDGE